MQFPQVDGQAVGIADVALQEIPPHAELGEVGGGRHEGFLVEIGPDELEGMDIEHLAADRSGPHHVLQMQQKRPVAASHIANASRLLVDGRVEYAFHHLVQKPEVCTVGSPRTPHIQGAVHVDLRIAGSNPPQVVAVPEDELL